MRRRKVWISLALMAGFLIAGGGTLYVLLSHRPNFYRVAQMSESRERTAQSGEFVNRYTGLMNSVFNRYPDWWGAFTTEQVNAFLQEDFLKSFGGDNNLPDGFHDLRIQIEEGKLRLGCRYDTLLLSTVLTIEVRMWLVANEVNLIGVEIVNLRAGALPISRQNVLDYITEAARQSNIDVKWHRRHGNPVAIFRLQADQVRPTILLHRFELQPGKIVIVGRSTEAPVTHSVERPSSLGKN